MKLEVIVEKPPVPARITPVLFIHGMWHGAWCWTEHFLPYFARQGFCSYAMSLRGHGKSEGKKKLRWTSMADYVSDVVQVVQMLDKSPVLVGHSMGGMVVQKYLESHPAPAAVLLASVPAQGVAATTLKMLFRHPMAVFKTNLKLSLYPIVSTPELAKEMLFSASMPDEKVLGYFKRLQDDSYRMYMDMLGLNLPKPQRVKTPVLVLGGGDDALFSPAQMESTASVYGTSAEIFDGMAHDMMLEARWKDVADRIIEWLKENGL